MPKLVKLETDANVSNYTPEEGKITTFFVEEDGVVKQKFKNSSGQIGEFTQNGMAVVDQPDPAITGPTVDGVITAGYTTVPGLTKQTTKTASMQLPVAGDMQVTLGGVKKTIPTKGYFFTHDVVIPPVELDPSKMAMGYYAYGYEGTLAGAVEPVVPDYCICFLSGGYLYVRNGSGIQGFSVHGLPVAEQQVVFNGSYWAKYGPFAAAGAFAGSVLSQDDVYLEWDGFSDFTKKWTLHTLVSGYPASQENWIDNSHPRFAWGFDKQDYTYEGNYEISDIPVYLYGRAATRNNTSVWVWDHTNSLDVSASGLFPAGVTWDGPAGYLYSLSALASSPRQLVWPYDEEMMMPGTKHSVGKKLYLGKPSTFNDNWDGYIEVRSGMVIGGFALELNPEGYTDMASYISPLLDGTYKYL